MRRIFAAILLLTLGASFAFADGVKHGQCWTVNELATLDKVDVAGGKGTLHGEFAFIRDNARDEDAIKEIGFMTLKHGEFIGVHSHKDNEDAYLILSGTGLFTDGDGNTHIVRPGDMTIARPGQSHGLANLYSDELVFLDIIAKNGAANLDAIKANPRSISRWKNFSTRTLNMPAERARVHCGENSRSGVSRLQRTRP